MKSESLIFVITAFLVADTYYEGKYSKYIMSGKKYFKMITFAFVGLSIYMFIKKHPNESKGMLFHAHNLIKYMPIDKNTSDLLTPLFDFTSVKNNVIGQQGGFYQTPQMKRMMGSGMNTNKRSVSETKKKYVAANQNWKCAYCGTTLDASFEVDHKVDLQFGGTNHVSNLAAVCRNCHGKKSMMHKLQ